MSSLDQLPFYSVTNIELLNILETPETRIKNYLEENNFKKYVYNALANVSDQSCKFYSVDDLNRHFSTDTSSISLMHVNIRSLSKNFGSLITLVNSIELDFDFIALSEIGRLNVENRASSIENEYNHQFKYEKPKSAKGGVGLIARNDIDLSSREDLKITVAKNSNINLEIENIWYEVRYPGRKQSVIIGVIYRHPGSNVEGLKHFTNELHRALSVISQEQKQCLICGDLNVDGLKIDNTHENTFFDTILSENFIPTITLPTRITEDTISLIDHIIINGTESCRTYNTYQSGNIYNDITDHLPIFIILKGEKNTERVERPMIRIYSKANIAKFSEKLNQEDWSEFYKCNDANQSLGLFYQKYRRAYSESFPLKRLSRKRAKDKKWVTIGIKISSHTKDMLYRKYLKNPSSENKRRYTTYKNIFTSCTRKAEEEYYKDLIDKEKQNVRKLWQIFGSLINPKRAKRKTKITKLLINDRVTTDDKEMAQGLNNYFVTVGENLAKNINGPTSFRDYLDHPNPHTFFLHPVQEIEMQKQLLKLKTNKGPGHDNISPKLLKLCADVVTKPLTHIINLSFLNGSIPDPLKIAKVIPVFKKNEETLPGNYRPISLLSVLHKVMEKLMYKRLYSFLIKYKILYEFQFGFREHYSTIMALVEIVDRIRTEADNGNITLGLYIDLSKAFDTVDHTILLHKLDHYGIRGIANDWIKSYLSARQQYTSVNGQKSEMQQIKYGVPQGSVLGPLLFLLYVNDINRGADAYAELRLFADDTNIFVTDSSPNQLKVKAEQTLNKLSKWFAANKLTVNSEKSCYSIFAPKNKILHNSLNSIRFGTNTINRVSSAKYLGVTLDEKLNWQQHIDNLCVDLIKIINSFKIVKRHVSHRNKFKLFNAYFHSKTQYGIEIYGNAGTTILKKVQTKQNMALKILFNKHFRTNTDNLHSELKTLKVIDAHKMSVAKFVYKHINDQLPPVFNDYFKPTANAHRHYTRGSLNIHVQGQSTERGKKTMQYSGARIWNNIPDNIRKAKTLKHFTAQTKKHWISKYKSTHES